jgi:hypothetical protein
MKKFVKEYWNYKIAGSEPRVRLECIHEKARGMNNVSLFSERFERKGYRYIPQRQYYCLHGETTCTDVGMTS